MSRVYEALKKLEAERASSPSSSAVAIDTVRVEQFIDLQRGLLLAADAPDDLAGRLVHQVATFLDVPGAAVGMVQGRTYDVLATYGVAYHDRARHHREAIDEPDLASVLRTGRPLMRHYDAEGKTRMQELILPFQGDLPGALHLVIPEGAIFGHEKVNLARVFAGLIGIALANARATA
jgi:hypothetical protein